MHKSPLEADEEKAFGKELSLWAANEKIELVNLKLSIIGRRGWPDRLILWEGGNLLFIEFKRPNGPPPRKLQEYAHRLIRRMGFTIEVHYDRNSALRSVQAKVRATTATARGDEVGDATWRIPTVSETRTGEDGSSPQGV